MQKSSSYRYYVLGMLTLVSTINVADPLVVSILLEDIKADFALSDAQIGILVGNVAGMGIGPFVIGLISDNLAPVYGTRSMNYSVASFCMVAGLTACLFYVWTAAAMRQAQSLKDLGEV